MAKQELLGTTAGANVDDHIFRDGPQSESPYVVACSSNEDATKGYEPDDGGQKLTGSASNTCGPKSQTGPPGDPANLKNARVEVTGRSWPKRLLNEFEAADRLGLSVKTLRRWRWAGHPPAFIKIGRAVRYDPGVIEALISAGRRVSTSDRGEDLA